MIGFFIGVAVGVAAAAVWVGLVRAKRVDDVEALASQLRHPAQFGGQVHDRQVWFCRCGSWGFFRPDGAHAEDGLMHEAGRCYPIEEGL